MKSSVCSLDKPESRVGIGISSSNGFMVIANAIAPHPKKTKVTVISARVENENCSASLRSGEATTFTEAPSLGFGDELYFEMNLLVVAPTWNSISGAWVVPSESDRSSKPTMVPLVFVHDRRSHHWRSCQNATPKQTIPAIQRATTAKVNNAEELIYPCKASPLILLLKSFDPYRGVIFSGGFGLLKKVNFKLVRMNTCVESGSDEHKKGTHDRGLRSRAGTT